jgi:hypothetical protein
MFCNQPKKFACPRRAKIKVIIHPFIREKIVFDRPFKSTLFSCHQHKDRKVAFGPRAPRKKEVLTKKENGSEKFKQKMFFSISVLSID